jgi:hypothetical protein
MFFLKACKKHDGLDSRVPGRHRRMMGVAVAGLAAAATVLVRGLVLWAGVASAGRRGTSSRKR